MVSLPPLPLLIAGPENSDTGLTVQRLLFSWAYVVLLVH